MCKVFYSEGFVWKKISLSNIHGTQGRHMIDKTAQIRRKTPITCPNGEKLKGGAY